VPKPEVEWPVYPRGAWFRNEAGPRAWGGRGRRGGYTITTAEAKAVQHTFAKEIPDEIRKYAEVSVNPDINATEFATDKVALEKEIIGATLLRTAANWSSSNDAEGGWAAGSGNTFITDVEAGKEVIRKAIGQYPNRMLIDAGTFSSLKNEDTVLQRIKYGGGPSDPALITAAMIAQMFELDLCVVGAGIYSSAEEVAGATDFTAANIWETNATKGMGLLLYVSPAPSIENPSAGYIFRVGDRVVERWREAPEHQDVVECAETYVVKITANYAGYLFTDTLLT
jgi:hypothetical protein